VAGVLASQSQFLVSRAQANIMREQFRQAKIESQRRAFDEWLYERANAPTPEDNRERDQRENLRRSLNDPPLPEIWSAKALNDLLDDLQKLQGRQVKGPQINLDPDVLRRVNVTSGKAGTNIGLLRDVQDGRSLTWPLALLELLPKGERERVEGVAREALREAVAARGVDGEKIRTLEATIGRLQEQLRRKIGRLPPAQYLEASRFLREFEDAVRLLRSPEAGRSIVRSSPQGGTVEALVRYMTSQGLLFAPAVSGDENAYLALQRALAAYVDEARRTALATAPDR
jgi:hypothetical protein